MLSILIYYLLHHRDRICWLQSALHLLFWLCLLVFWWLYNPFWLIFLTKQYPKLCNWWQCLLLSGCLLPLVVLMDQYLHCTLFPSQICHWFYLTNLWLKNQRLALQLKLLLTHRKFLDSLHFDARVRNKVSCSKYSMHFRPLMLLYLRWCRLPLKLLLYLLLLLDWGNLVARCICESDTQPCARLCIFYKVMI